MSTEAISKLQPNRTMYLRGFDRRGAAAAMSGASSSGFKVTGLWSDQADFAVLVLLDEDDLYGHLETTRYLPSANMTGATLEFDVALTACFSPTSVKFDSLLAGQLQYITSAEVSGSLPLASLMTSTTGGSPASVAITISGTIVLNDLFYIIYLGNNQALYQAPIGATPTSVASGLTFAMNTGMVAGLSLTPFAVWNGSTGLTVFAGRSAASSLFTLSGTSLVLNTGSMTAAQAAITGFWGLQPGDVVMFTDGSGMEKHTVSSVVSPWSIVLDSAVAITPTIGAWPLYQADGNTAQLQVMTNSALGTMTPHGAVKLAGGASETSLHLKLDFSALGLTSLRQAWLTLGPVLNVDTSGSGQTIAAFTATDFSAVFSSWTPAGSALSLKIAGPGSVTIGSQDKWATYSGTNWTTQPNGAGNYGLAANYFHGFSEITANPGDAVTVAYSCQYVHDLYVGTALHTSCGELHISVDGVSQPDVDLYAASAIPLTTRRLLKSGVAAGAHTVLLTVSSTKNANSTGHNAVLDYVQAAVTSDVQDPPTTYSTVNVAMDYDTDQTYKLPPERALWIAQRMGFAGDIDFYAGVFFALKRIRTGGSFRQAAVTVGGTLVSGDSCFIDVAGTNLGVGITSIDTTSTVAQRFVNAVNATFVGISASASGAVITLTCLSPINGFSLIVTSGATVTLTKTGDIGFGSAPLAGGNEGTWGVDASQTQPLNQAFIDWFSDFCALLHTAGQSCTCAFSQELLGPPDANTSIGAWTQRYPNGVPVLTDTGFGSWGAGKVESYSAPTVTQTGHGYITGSQVSLASSSGSGSWIVTTTSANTYQLTTQVNNSGGYVPAVGDSALSSLQTSQCAFNPSTVTPYMAAYFTQTAAIMAAASLTPWLQFGEILHWFFSYTQSLPVTGVAMTSPVKITTGTAHGFATGQTTILAGLAGNVPPALLGIQTITVTSPTQFTVNGSIGSGTWTGGGTVSGGGMALYDANQTAAATAALGRSLASFWTQDDDPTVNSSADANFLAGRLKTHCDSIRTAVLTVTAGAKFELLFPYDVCYPTCYFTTAVPYPQGGRLNRAVNLPSAWNTKAGSGLDRMKTEGLSWSATYRNSTLAQETVLFPYTVLSWSKSDTRCLIPWFNGGCHWSKEFLFCVAQGTPAINFWAFDHAVLFSWTTSPLPTPKRRVTSR